MTEETSFNTLNILRAMISYTDPAADSAYRDLVLFELGQRIEKAPRTASILKALLSSPRHIPFDFLRRYLDAVGHDLLDDLTDIDLNPVAPIDCVELTDFAPGDRRTLVDLCAAHHPAGRLPARPGRLVSAAIASGDIALLERVRHLCQDSEEALLFRIESSSALEEAGPEAAPAIEDFLQAADFSSQQWHKVISELIRKKRARSLALLIAAGWHPRHALCENEDAKKAGSWIQRFAFRLNESRHAEFENPVGVSEYSRRS